MSLDRLVILGKQSKSRKQLKTDGQAVAAWGAFCKDLVRYHQQQLVDAGLAPITPRYRLKEKEFKLRMYQSSGKYIKRPEN